MPNQHLWTPLHVALHRTLRQRQILPQKQRLLLAVSGGQDSLCLTKLLLDLQPQWGWDLAMAHCDHRWRSDSQANADYVEKLAMIWQLPFYRETATIISKTEAEARQWRYQVLGSIALNHNYNYIVTGHTESDRAETLLYNLIRGSGADGLAALTWQRLLFSEPRNIYLVRPLLEINRSQTGAFCQAQNIEIWEDYTNQDLDYARNKIRQKLIPMLQDFNPKAETSIAQTAELLRADVEYLEDMAEQLLAKATENTPKDIFNNGQKIIDRRLLSTVSLALQRRVMRQLLQSILPCSPNFEQIEKLTNLIKAPHRSQTDPFPGGAIAYVNHPWIIIDKFDPI